MSAPIPRNLAHRAADVSGMHARVYTLAVRLLRGEEVRFTSPRTGHVYVADARRVRWIHDARTDGAEVVRGDAFEVAKYLVREGWGS